VKSVAQSFDDMETQDSQHSHPDLTAEAKKAKRWLARVVFFFLLINAVVLYKVLQAPEPTYNGLTVAGWCKRINSGPLEPKVVNTFGPTATAKLVEVVASRQSPLDRAWRTIWQKVPNTFRKRFHALQPYDRVGARGTAVHWLIEFIKRTTNPWSERRGVYKALRGVDP
jgi:hypothetical protein